MSDEEIACTPLKHDIMYGVVARSSLWTARKLARTHPTLARIVDQLIQEAVDAAMREAPPASASSFLVTRSDSFREMVHDDFVCLGTPKRTSLFYTVRGVGVTLCLEWDITPRHHLARITLEVGMDACPDFPSLLVGLKGLWWMVVLANACQPTKMKITTRSRHLRPVSEGLNAVATSFVDRFVRKRVTAELEVVGQGTDTFS